MPELCFDKMLFNIPAGSHEYEEVKKILEAHKEVQFVSLVGVDIGGYDTDEKIPISLFLEDFDKFFKSGVQTDGSSVVLPKIANINNAKVDIIPDKNVNWYVDYNYHNIDFVTGLPVGTLRIPSFLLHNDAMEVGARVILRDATYNFKKDLLELIKNNPYVFEYLPIDSVDEIEEIGLTCATELEFWVKTPDEKADTEQLSAAQILKKQYWKRTIGPVRTALEQTLYILDKYGLEMEMGHKEVGGVKAKMGNAGHFDHVMEQLEIDWKYSTEMQAADNENLVKYVVKEVFRMHGLDVTFMAKPVNGVAGSGEHTHVGVVAKLKNGKSINLFSPLDFKKDFLNPIGYGALMGILKNYEVINPFVSSSNDAFNRLKPGFEAPVCIVTSIGKSVDLPSRNRTVLLGLIRDFKAPMATRFELRSPNPKSNTYLVIAACYMAMLDGIKAALEGRKTPSDLYTSLTKNCGDEDFYLETDRKYRSERDVFDEYTAGERDKLFGKAPGTVWENIKAFEKYPKKLDIFRRDDVMTQLSLDSYKEAVIEQWAIELEKVIVPKTMEEVRSCKKLHNDDDCTDFDIENWKQIEALKKELAKDKIKEKCLLTEIEIAIESKDYDKASNLQLLMQKKVEELIKIYSIYEKNLI